MKRVTLTADLVEAFSGIFLSPLYDMPQPTPDFHRKCWRLYCSSHPQCAVAAPRNHAKSTALTHDFGLAVGLFRAQDYIIILGATEEMAIEHLGDIASELRTNDNLIQEFGIKGFLTDQKTDIIVEFNDGHQLRYIARGGEQKIRGKKWKGKRPGMIIGDDIEDDEQVESKDRRDKFWRWLLRAAKQSLRDGGQIRIHGTILHEDSALSKIMRHKSWHTLRFRAHKDFSDFSELLWPEKFPEERLRAIRQEFVDGGDTPGYSQEYLNDPFDHENAYLRRDDFVPMSEDDYDLQKRFCVGWDFAISQKEHADLTSGTVGGKDITNLLHIVDQRKGQWAADRIIDEMLSVERAWHPDFHFVEKGGIWEGLRPILEKEMQKQDTWLNIVPMASLKEKAVRGRTLQKRHRSRGMRFDKNSTWYAEYEAELLRFTGYNEATRDDQFDSTSILCRGFEFQPEIEEDDFTPEEEILMRTQDPRSTEGRNPTTGY